MIRLGGLKVKAQDAPSDITGLKSLLTKKAADTLGIPHSAVRNLEIARQSIDARKKPVLYVFTVDFETPKEHRILSGKRCSDASHYERPVYHFPGSGTEVLAHRPVIAGCGPAGMFCALMLAEAGYRPVIIERGDRVSKRRQRVELFWKTGVPDPDSNVQFGEGGAGTFSDGKIGTMVKDRGGRGRLVLETFVEAGAPPEILYLAKPHLGTDCLAGIVENIRMRIEALGGEVFFRTALKDIEIKDGAVNAVYVGKSDGTSERICTDVLVAAIGHSARDTFSMFEQRGVPMEKKAFAVGVRIEHPQEMIDEYQYGSGGRGGLPPASYKLTRRTSSGRGVYSFCMCPGGFVVDASTGERQKAVNGMSCSARDGHNANSAIVAAVTPRDFPGASVLSGVEFQKMLERAAYSAGGGRLPLQLLGDFLKNRPSSSLGGINPSVKGGWAFGDVRGIFPEEISAALSEGIMGFENIIPGFCRSDALLYGVESRTSSPVRILRGGDMQSALRGLYPVGEGAGYAGGITSAAMDGIKAAEMIASRYRPL